MSPMKPENARNPVLRCALIGGVVNALLCLIQALGGLLFRSPALLADALHTGTDLVSDIVVAVGTRMAQAPPDDDHPYGHGKYETIAQQIVAVIMIATGIVFAIEVYEDLLNPPSTSPLAVWVAVVTLITKESLYQYTSRTARRLGNKLLSANAWHHRTDAISSVAVLASLIGSRLGFPFLDPLAGMLIASAITYTGVNFAIKATRDLVEASADESLVDEIREIASRQDGVRRVHEVRARHIGSQVVVDLHVMVDGRISVSDGHQVAVRVSRAVDDAVSSVTDVLVHIDPEDDEEYPTIIHRSGAQIEGDVRHCLKHVAGVQDVSHVTVHYLEGRTTVSLEIVVDPDLNIRAASDIATRARLELLEIPDIDEADLHLEVDDGRHAQDIP